MHKTFNIDNLKCDGCANSIKKNLLSLNGINDVNVDIEHNSISIDLEQQDGVIDEVLRTLKSMGYSQKGTSNLLDKAKSYVSCAIGRLSDDVSQ